MIDEWKIHILKIQLTFILFIFNYHTFTLFKRDKTLCVAIFSNAYSILAIFTELWIMYYFSFVDHQKLEREARICRALKHPNIGKESIPPGHPNYPKWSNDMWSNRIKGTWCLILLIFNFGNYTFPAFYEEVWNEILCKVFSFLFILDWLPRCWYFLSLFKKIPSLNIIHNSLHFSAISFMILHWHTHSVWETDI